MHRAPDFDQLYRAHYDFVWRSAKRLGVPQAALDDVLQETFIVAYRRLPDYDGRAAHTTWLFGILHNVWRNHRRGRRRSARKHDLFEQRRAIAESMRLTHSEFNAQARLARRLLAEFLAELDPRQRSVFVLAELEGMTGPEIADALDVGVNTARSRLRAARAAFARRFGESEAVQALTHTLRAAPSEAPTEQRSRTRALVLVSLGQPARRATALGLAKAMPTWLGGLASLALVTLGAVVGVRGLTPGSEQPSPTAAVRARGSAPPATAERARPEPAPTATPEALAPIVVAAPEAPATPPSSARGDRSGRADYAELEAARAALLDGAPQRALSFAREIDADGPLAWERAATEVAALCELGRHEAARAVARAHETRDPRRSIPALCWTP